MMGLKTTTEATPKSNERALINALSLHLGASQLPGDRPVDKPALEAAAGYLLAAARTRAPGQPLVQIESTSGERRHLRIAIINEDMPFLVDSVAATIAAQSLGIDLLLHPVIVVERDSAGAIT
ncbi:MAG: hypothetical protein CVT77_18085, partial [Alphaproteobacteria bacterium HGW-Alphaproteobacteria-16]